MLAHQHFDKPRNSSNTSAGKNNLTVVLFFAAPGAVTTGERMNQVAVGFELRRPACNGPPSTVSDLSVPIDFPTVSRLFDQVGRSGLPAPTGFRPLRQKRSLRAATPLVPALHLLAANMDAQAHRLRLAVLIEFALVDDGKKDIKDR